MNQDQSRTEIQKTNDEIIRKLLLDNQDKLAEAQGIMRKVIVAKIDRDYARREALSRMLPQVYGKADNE